MTAKPSRTTNRLHFTDLDPARFEDLCLGLIYTLRPWSDVRHYGRLGGDGGVDILATEPLENAAERTWFVQCRRYRRASRRELLRAVDDALEKAERAPDVLVVVIACDVSRAAHEAFTAHARSKGVGLPLVWSQSVLEATLYAERRDLLFSYFGVSMASDSRAREQTVRRNIELKRRIIAELTQAIDPEVLLIRPEKRFHSSRAIIHSIDDSSYPSVESRETGISSWFRLQFFDLYHNGVEFALGIEYALLDREDHWTVIPHGYEVPSDEFQKVKVWHTGCIPFRNIVEIDTIGDEYYSEPHLYCRFADGGEPYEEFRYRLCVDGRYPHRLDPELRRPLEEMSRPTA